MRPRLITAENVQDPAPLKVCEKCFNEAAAHHRGERRQRRAVDDVAVDASMRPRLITAENGSPEEREPRGATASMRPRLITAEN